MKKIHLMVCILCLALFVSACAPSPSVTNPTGGHVNNEDKNAPYFSSGMNNEVAEMPYTYELTAEAGDLRKGKVIVTINRSWVVTNQADIPEKGGIRSDYMWPTTYEQYKEDGSHEELWYPQDLVQEDGSFANGAYFVMIEMTLTSEDAENWTSDDSYETTGGAGTEPDPYIFWTPGGLQYPDSKSIHSGPAYFSELNSVPNGSSYRMYLYPGETKTIVVGWLVRGNMETCAPYEYSELGYTVTFGFGQNLTYINLSDLEE